MQLSRSLALPSGPTLFARVIASTLKGVVQRSPGLPTDRRQPWVRAIRATAILKGLCRTLDTFRPTKQLMDVAVSEPIYLRVVFTTKSVWRLQVLQNPFRVLAPISSLTLGCPTLAGQPWAALQNAFSVRAPATPRLTSLNPLAPLNCPLNVLSHWRPLCPVLSC